MSNFLLHNFLIYIIFVKLFPSKFIIIHSKLYINLSLFICFINPQYWFHVRCFCFKVISFNNIAIIENSIKIWKIKVVNSVILSNAHYLSFCQKNRVFDQFLTYECFNFKIIAILYFYVIIRKENFCIVSHWS